MMPNHTDKIIMKTKFITSILIIGFINFLGLVALIFFVGNLSPQSNEIKRLKSLSVKQDQTNLGVIQAEILSSKNKADKLLAVFPDESTIINFVKEIDTLKKDKLVTHFSFATQNIIKDKTGFWGLPFVIESAGSWQQLNATLGNIYRFPYFIRAVSVELKKVSEDEFSLKYGGIIYVSQNFGGD